LALIHIAVVAPRYHVGSFDDDAAYVIMAQGILHGVGLGGYLVHHVALLDAYPPGYPLLLAPLQWLFGGGSYLPERLLSTVCMGAIFPLCWVWLGRRGVPELTRVAVLLLLALNPLVGTYGSMVMAEAPFLLGFIVLLIVSDRWVESGRAWCWSAAATVALVVVEIWLKEAALGFLPGLIGWLAWRRRWGRAAVSAIAATAALMPIVLGRLATGVPVAGSRYSSELGGYYRGGSLHRLALVPQGIAEWCFDALPSALVPTDSPLDATTALFVVFRGLACATTALFVGIGIVTWIRRRGADLAVFVVGAYAAEVCLYKYVNDRRALLVLPVLATWYVIGMTRAYLWVVERIRQRQPLITRWKRGVALWGALAVAGPLAAQFPTDYRYALGQSSSAPAGSPYMTLLSQLGTPSQVVETTFLWSTALLSGHATDDAAAIASGARACDPASAARDLRSDHASYLLSAAIDIPGQVDSPCLDEVASGAPWAVPLLQTSVDDASVYELVGPQTAQPDVRALLSVATATIAPSRATLPRHPLTERYVAKTTTASQRWSLPAATVVRQVSLGGLRATQGTTGQVSVRLLEGKRWRTVTSTTGPVGEGSGVPFLLANLADGTRASAVQVSVTASAPVIVDDLAVLGATAPPRGASATPALSASRGPSAVRSKA
jgi:hypothetical protein